MIQRLIPLVTAVLLTPAAWADYMVLDTGELMPKGNYKFTGTAQALTENAGLDLSGRVDLGVNEDFGVRGIFGFGKLDMYGGGMVKWTPIKDDNKNTPAIGLNAGLIYISDGDVKDMIIRGEPLVSKRIDIDEVTLIPYVSMPVNMRMRRSDDDRIDEKDEVALQLVVGSQLRIPQVKPELQFIAEVGIDLNESPGYIGLGAIYYLDTTGEGANKSLTPAKPSDNGGAIED